MLGSKYLVNHWVVHREFETQQVDPLIVPLFAVSISAVLDPYAFDSLPEGRQDLGVAGLRDSPILSKSMAEKSKHIWTLERGHGVLNQGGVALVERCIVLEKNICGPLALKNGPIVIERKL